jgi:uncharacterized protein
VSVLSADLLEVLVDPQDKSPLFYVEPESVLYNARQKRAYEVSAQGIPNMLLSDARLVDNAEHERLMKVVQHQELKPTGGRK